ncbi:hypothetical protein SAMN05216270_107134 [Glycomyces harbinensis]|uniref:Uncharacterized protein n=2 Tax=Glycomyces harbinensis TaxID=58114 RepID=A0A1G6XEZ3_9ACTN|nr:hypothetical protein SAMN05216270_107134 [Glycomyces harbinensis]
MRPSVAERSIAVERRRFRNFLWLVALLSLTLLVLVQVVFQRGSASGSALIGRGADEVVLAATSAVFGAALGSALVGILLDEYQRRFSGRVSEYDQFLHNEGLIAVYESSQEPALLSAMEKAISDARAEVVGVGLGLSVLANRVLLLRVAERLSAEKSLRVRIHLGSPDNPGVMNRMREEEAWHRSNDLAYDATWPEFLPKEIRSTLERYAGQANHSRIEVTRIRSCPTIGVLKFDKRMFVFLYGAPDMRGGSQSVWMELDATERTGNLNSFILKYIEYFSAEADEVRRMGAEAP